MSMAVETSFQRVSLDAVLRYYAEGFQLRPGASLLRWDALVDTSKREVVFELTAGVQPPGTE